MPDSATSAFTPYTLGEVSAALSPVSQRDVNVKVALVGSVDPDWRSEFKAIVNGLSQHASFRGASVVISGIQSYIQYTVAEDSLEASVAEIRNVVDRTNEAFASTILPARKAEKDKLDAEDAERSRRESALTERLKDINNPQ